MDSVDLDIIPNGQTNGRHFGQNWQKRRAHLKELAELRRLLPPNDKVAELNVLGMMVASPEQGEKIAGLLEQADFYCDELGVLFALWKPVGARPKTDPERKSVGQRMVAAGVAKLETEPAQIVEACARLRELRIQRRRDLAAETIYLAHDSVDWLALVKREAKAVEAIAAIETQEKTT